MSYDSQSTLKGIWDMLISHNNNFLFVHICKTAGSSVRLALEPYADEMPDDRLSKLASKLGLVRGKERVYIPKHASGLYARPRLGAETFNRLYKFTFVRNPWDLLVSSFHYIKGNERHHRHAKVSKLNTFEAFVEYEIRRGKLHQHKAICEKDGTFLVDFIGRFETPEKDFKHICKEIGVEPCLPHANASRHFSYRSYYNQRLRE